jgi:succinate dehydrogenase / fumarate reductase cytochrome b subunit
MTGRYPLREASNETRPKELEMKRVALLWRSSVGKKALTSLSGVLFFGWICLHLLGNLTAFSGAAAMNVYAASLRHAAPLLWLSRLVLFAAVALHVVSSLSLARAARASRPQSIARRPRRSSTFASRSLRVGGPLLLGFLVFHLAHLTFGVGNPHFVPGRVYENVVSGLRSPGAATVYVVAAALVGLHLHHALYAARTSLGIAPPSDGNARRPVAVAIALAVAVGFASVPLAVAFGALR